jgi:hypothetical protein
VHPAPSGKEPSLLTPRRFNNYAAPLVPPHEPGSLFLCSEEEGRDPARWNFALYSLKGIKRINQTVHFGEVAIESRGILSVGAPARLVAYSLRAYSGATCTDLVSGEGGEDLDGRHAASTRRLATKQSRRAATSSSKCGGSSTTGRLRST